MRRIILGLVLLATPSLALADVVGPAREDCPPGSEDVFCHGPPTCRPVVCGAGCPDGTTCGEQRYCLQSNNCGGRAGTPVYDNALLSCSSDADCSESGTLCQAVSVCVNDGCGCSAPGRASRAPLSFMLGLLALALWRRR